MKQLKNETKEKSGGFFSVLWGTLTASILRLVLAGLEVIRAGKGTIRAGKSTVIAGENFYCYHLL